MTANTKTLEAIRLLRDEASGAHNRDWETMCGALADALEESIQPSAEKRGEAPDPLPEVLPVGTRATGGDGTRWVAESEVTWDGPNAKRYTGMWRADEEDDYSECGIDQRCIDWAHWRATHSPPPSREGERKLEDDLTPKFMARGVECWLTLNSYGATWRAIDADIAAVLAAMPEERRSRLVAPYVGLREDYIERANVLRQRAEAAEERAASLESDVDTLRGELEAARARVGVLHEAIIRALNVMAPNDLAGARLQDALDATGFVREDEEGPDEQREDPLQAKEAMVASVPAAAETELGVLRPPVHGGGEVAPPRDSGGEVGVSLVTAEQYAYSKGIEHERHGVGGWHWLTDAEDRAYWRGRESVKEKRAHEQREGQAQEAEAPMADVVPVPAKRSGDAGGDSDPKGSRVGVDVAPPGLTPEEAEGGARRAFDAAKAIVERDYPHIAVFSLQPRDMPLWEHAYRFAHSEGAAEAGKRVAELVEASRALVTVNLMGGKPLQGKLPDAVRSALAELENPK